MRTFITLFIIGIVIALVLLIGTLHYSDYVSVRIIIGQWLIETNLWVMITLGLTFIIAIIFTLITIVKLAKSGKSIFAILGLSGNQRASTNTEKGLIALLEGNWKQANKLLSKCLKEPWAIFLHGLQP